MHKITQLRINYSDDKVADLCLYYIVELGHAFGVYEG